MHLTFQLKSSKLFPSGKAPIYARLTVDGQRKEFSIKRSIEPAKWIPGAGQVKGNSEEARSINAFLNMVRLKLYEHQRTLLERNQVASTEAIINAYLGKVGKGKTLVEAFELHNQQMKSLIHKDYAPGTYERYTTALKHIKEFIQHKYGKEDLPLTGIDYEFITAFEHFLKTVRNCDHNTAMKYITNFKKVVRICLGHGWISRDPFINYKIRLREVKRDILSLEEIYTIMHKKLTSDRLSRVRDVFIFCCFTGLAYADVKKLSKQHIVKGVDGELWIKVHRTKTDTLSSIPLLPPAQQILDRYQDHSTCLASDRLLPVSSNQKFNDMIKEVIAICEINKVVSSHTARHSFSTSVMLGNNVPIETISKLLGHSSLSITQHYARTLDHKISKDVESLKKKFERVFDLKNAKANK